ncbi:PucR family transcriptional regulator [Nocardia yunnanensis]|uniref:PucR family transcriptional regulator n=1 Tax=Nocardia yunnanensis TaxID=2382165 RepID=A0A386ZP72_9NOCA|nr:helix-turn-helix domain-containing protein [Nocardia yunnanensis]AYF79246.1 PucR family transcriptional regulator [Nocardia yunnanensis]
MVQATNSVGSASATSGPGSAGRQPFTTARSLETATAAPISDPLRDVRSLSAALVAHFAEHVARCGTLPGDALRGEVTAVTRTCLELAAGVLEGRDVAAKIERLQRAGADWAREGIPIGTIHRAVHDGFALGFDLIVDATGPEDYARLAVTARRLFEVLAMVDSAFAVAYVREHRAVVAEHHTAVHTVASALLAGHPTSTMARAGGVEIDESYDILALSIPPHPGESDPRVDGEVVARRKLRRVQSALADRGAGRALSLLSADGGTVLLPASEVAVGELDDLVAGLSTAAQVPITATVIRAATPDIPGAAEQAHELLDMVHRLEGKPGLHRFDALAMEYQLTRPGPGREYLGTLLDPLDEHPELLETLRRHIGNDLSRRHTARLLGVHTNTVDNRLKRIGQLTGFDPAQPSGLWYLRSALVARSYRKAERVRIGRPAAMVASNAMK